MLSSPLPFTPHASHLHMAEKVGIRSRACRNCTCSYRGGQPPRRLPTRGTHPPRSPLFESHPRSFHALLHSRPLRFTPHVSHPSVWRRGWDSNPRSHCWDACFPSMSIRPLSHLSTPIFARPHLSMWSDDQQVDRRGLSSHSRNVLFLPK